MAIHKLYNAFVSVGGTTISSRITAVTVDQSVDALPVTAMGNATKINLGGLLDWTINLDGLQDYDASVDALLSPLVGTTAAVIVRPDSAGAGATNPSWTGTGLLTAYTPVGGNVGDAHKFKATFMAAGTLVRATA